MCAPQPANISCADLSTDTDLNDVEVLQGLFGMAQGVDICTGIVVEELTPVVTMQNCGLGSVIRSFTVTDPSGNSSSCQQLISINPATNYAIKFPRDVVGDCAEPGADTLVIENAGCDNFAVNVTEQTFTVPGDGACYKIFRTYTVINWCEYDGFPRP
ncbi:MAG: hypothetical protein R2795_07935 [Saprospiraceae bacterium]